MNKLEFKALFERSLNLAAENCEKQLGQAVSRNFEIELHGLADHSRKLGPDEVLEEIYLAPDCFYRIIDLMVIRVTDHKTTVFLCVSGHPPGSFDETWNQPPGSGPFKQLSPGKIESTRTLD